MKKVYEAVLGRDEYKDFLNKTFMSATVTLGIILFLMFITVSAMGIFSRTLMMIPVSFLVFLFIMIYNIRSNFVKGMKAFSASGLDKRNITYVFEQKALKVITENTSNEIKYKKFYKITETDLSFLFYVNKVSAFIVPKRIFRPEDIEELKSVLSSCGADKALKLK